MYKEYKKDLMEEVAKDE